MGQEPTHSASEQRSNFILIESVSAIALLAATVLALAWRNSAWGAAYGSFWQLAAGARPVTLQAFVNEGLMSLFFLTAGLEIRRELHDGALARATAAVVPVAAALGGILVPALLYLAIAHSAPLGRGWAIPTATDIAFAVGALGLLGRRVPTAVRVLLLALAIVDDVVAILVIALVYSAGVDPTGLLVAAGGVLGVMLFQRLGVHQAVVYLIPGVIVWAGLWRAGVNPTLAGVALGFMTPLAARRTATTKVLPPAACAQKTLHPWVAFGVMPLFALANAGVRLDGLALGTRSGALLVTAIASALIVGKPVGILAFTWLATRTRWGTLPRNLTWRGVALAGCFGGIGFTMSIFIAGLAMNDPALLATAKFAVLVASLVAGASGLVLGRFALFR